MAAFEAGALLLLLLPLLATALPEKRVSETPKRDETERLVGGDVTAGGTEKLGETREKLVKANGKLVEANGKLIEKDAELIGEDTVLIEEVADRQYWSPDCPDGFYKYWSASNVVSVCYYVSRSKQDWFGARDACKQLTPSSSRCFTTLASVMNHNENDFISDLMVTEGVRDHVWIGLTDRTYEGYFDWLDRRQLGFSFFYQGEPNNGNEQQNSQQPGEDCVELMYGFSGQWNDRSCTDQKYYACKAYCV